VKSRSSGTGARWLRAALPACSGRAGIGPAVPPLALSVLGAVAAMLAFAAELPGRGALPLILCSTPEAPQPGASVTTVQSEPLVGMPNKRITTQLVRFPPGAAAPRHVHGGDLSVYVLKGSVRSEHAGMPIAEFHAGQMFYEPQGTVHVFIENPSATETAELLAVMVHEEGAELTTFLD